MLSSVVYSSTLLTKRACLPTACYAAGQIRSIHVEKKIADMGLTLPQPSSPKGSYVTATRCGNLLFTAGHLPQKADGSLIQGKVGADVTVEEGNKAAQLVGLNLLSTIKAQVGDLDNVRVVKLVGFVNCVDGFTQQPQVVNGISDFLGEVLGENGTHARSAVGTNALPLNVCVEVEAVVEILSGEPEL